MNSFRALITLALTLDACYSWASMSSGGMSGVTYASGTIYNTNTMCPSNVNQGYVCDGRNFGDQYLDAGEMSAFCAGHTGSSRQFGFGHGVTASQVCGQCAQIRVPRTDGTYNYMSVMMVDHFTWSMEVGTTEIAYLVDNTKWVVGDRANFEYRIVNDYDCYAAFDGDTPTTTTTTTPTPIGSGSCGGSTRCGATWSDANAKCGQCCTTDDGCTTPGSSHCYADLAISPCNTAATSSTSTSTTTSSTSTTSSSTSTSTSTSSSSSSGDCGVSSNWGAMKINPYWGSSRSSMYAMITGSPARITSFEIRGSNQNNNEFQRCVYQNSNAFQCSLSGGALAEPASVKLNGGAYYGLNIIESMTGSSEMYPLTPCMGQATMEMDEDGNAVRWPWTVWFVIVAMVLVFICLIVGVAIYLKRKKQRKGRQFETGTLQLRDNDGSDNKAMETKKAFEIIDTNTIEDEDGGDDETEIEIEIDVEVENDGYLVTNS